MPSEAILRNAENNALSNTEPSFYRGTGKSAPDANHTQTKGKKKKGGIAALAIILCLIGGGCGFLATSHSLLGPAMSALFTETSDTGYASYALRSARITSFFLKGSGVSNGQFSNMSDSFRTRLTSQGFTVNGSGADTTLTFKGQTYDSSSFINAYYDNPELRSSYTTAKYGRVANYFDTVIGKVFNRLGLPRNIWSNYKDTGDETLNAQNYTKTLGDKVDSINGGSSLTTTHEEEHEYEYKDAQGETKTKTIIETDTETSNSKTISGDTPEAKASNYISGIASTVQKSINWPCTAIRVFNLLSNAITSLRLYQTMQIFMGNIENVSKMMAGDGSSSAINTMLNDFTTTTTVTVDNYNDPTNLGGTLPTSADESGTFSPQTGDQISYTGAATEATAFQAIMAGATIDQDQANNFSLQRENSFMGKALAFSSNPNITKTCAAGAASAAAVSLGVSLIPGIGQLKIAGSFVLKTALGFVGSFAVSAFLGFMIPVIARTFFVGALVGLAGIALGNIFASGAIATGTRNGRNGSGQFYASEEAALAQARNTERVLALDAEVDRLTRSPFDITSRHTFLGSIAYSLLPLTFSKQTSLPNTITRSTSTAISNLINTNTYATSATNTYLTQFGNCPELEELGAVGDAFCNPITASSFSLDLNFDELLNELKNDGLEVASDGTYKVKANSNLQKYLTACTNRDSMLGTVDANILNALQTNNLATTFFSAVPGVSSLVDLLKAGSEMANINWASGQNCVYNPQTNDQSSRIAYYQEFIESDRILSQITGNTSVVSAFIDEYDKKYPLDNTPSGYIARISGITKDDAELVLDVVAYYEFLDNYDADSRLAMNGHATDSKDGDTVIAEIESIQPRIKEEPKDSPVNLIAQHIIYADIRNRSYAV